MKMLSFVRSYYLYFYFHITELKRKKGEASFPPRGFVHILFLVMAFHAATIIYAINALWFEFITEEWRQQIASFRGNVNLTVVVVILLGILLTYLVCCYKVDYSEIEARLKQTPFLSNRSAIKLVLLPVFSFSGLILTVVLLY